MKTLKSKIVVIVYNNYEENVDMLNPLFKQSELNTLIKNDIVCVDYYINGYKVEGKITTAKSAISQTLKLLTQEFEIYSEMEDEGGKGWAGKLRRNEEREAKMGKLQDKRSILSQFIDQESFENSDLPGELCCDWDDFKHDVYR